MPKRSIHVIWNRHAGSAGRNAAVRDALAARSDVTLLTPESGEEARRMAAHAVTIGADVVVAAGGDGTINDVAQGLMDAGGETALGAIPLGTGNDFCRNTGVPLEPAAAAGLLDGGELRKIDVVRVEIGNNAAHYINMATGGNTGLYTDVVTSEMKQFWGPLVYVRGVVDILADLQVYRLAVVFDDEPPIELDALNVFAANGSGTGGGLLVAPDAQMDDGLLDVIVVRDCSPFEIAGLATDYAIRDYRENENILHRQVREMTISSRPPLVFSTDGDVMRDVNENEPIRFRVQPHALRLLAGSGRG